MHKMYNVDNLQCFWSLPDQHKCPAKNSSVWQEIVKFYIEMLAWINKNLSSVRE